MLDSREFLLNAMLLVPMLLSLTVHEWAHAWSAWKLGDDTAERMGRLTLNPIPHIDILGTIILPLLGVPFGWAKPVPVNPVRFTRRFSMRGGMMITAAAGPLSNLVLATLSALVFALLARWWPQTLLDHGGAVRMLLIYFIYVNVGLAVFNMVPIPPLDGSRIVDGIMPQRFRPAWEGFERFAPFALMGLLVYGQVAGGLLSGPRDVVVGVLNSLIQAIAG